MTDTLLTAAGALAGSPFARRREDPHHAVARDGRYTRRGTHQADRSIQCQPGQVEVTGLFKGAYKDLLTSVVAAWRAGQAPHIAQVFEVGTQTMLSSGPVIKPVWQLAQETGVKIDPDAYIPAVRGYYSQADGKLMSMPFNSSTCIVWYNQDVFEKAGLIRSRCPRHGRRSIRLPHGAP